MPSFLTELYQLFFSYLRLEDLKSAVMVSERWQDTGEVLKLWEDKKVANQDDDSMSLSSAMHTVKRRVPQVQSRLKNSLVDRKLE